MIFVAYPSNIIKGSFKQTGKIFKQSQIVRGHTVGYFCKYLLKITGTAKISLHVNVVLKCQKYSSLDHCASKLKLSDHGAMMNIALQDRGLYLYERRWRNIRSFVQITQNRTHHFALPYDDIDVHAFHSLQSQSKKLLVVSQMASPL